MKHLSKLFIRGAVTLLPFGLTLVIMLSFLMWTENFSRRIFSVVASDFYFPGLGLIIGVALICLLGLLTTMPYMNRVLRAVELPFKNVPILKSVYTAAKSLSDYFSPEAEHSDQQVVVVKFPGWDVELMGLVTRRNLNDLPSEFDKKDRVAVFLPLSYQIGGLTVFVPRAFIKRTDLKVEVAMRSALTAWMPGMAEDKSEEKT